MPRKRRQVLALTGSMVGITAVLAAAQSPASAQDNSTASRPWTVYAAGAVGNISTYPVGASSPQSFIGERPLLAVAGRSVMSPDGKMLYVSSTNGANLFVTPYNTVTRKAGVPIFVGSSVVNGPLAISPDGSTLYTSTFGDSEISVVAISTSTWQTRELISGVPALYPALAVSPDGKTVYVGTIALNLDLTATPGVLKLDAATGEQQAFYTVDGVPLAVAMTPDGSKLWVKMFGNAGNGNDSLTPMDPATGTEGTPISLGSGVAANSTLLRPEDLAITPDGRKAYVGVDSNGTVIPVDLVNQTAGSPISINAAGVPVNALAITPDGRTVEAVDGTVTPINTSTNTKGKPVNTGNLPVTVSITPDQAPTASFLATTHPHGSATSFNGSGSHAVTGHIRSYTWQFGDGQTATTSTPTTTHVYSQAGNYTATLTVTDTAGTSTTVVFTGQSVLRNGGPSAQKSVTLNIS